MTVRSGAVPRTMSISGAPGRSRSSGMRCKPDAIDDGREAVDQRYRLAAGDTLGTSGPAMIIGTAGQLLVHVGLAPQPARAEVVAVVAGVDDARVAGEAVVLERLHQPADVVVDEADEAEVGGDRLAHLGRIVEALVVDLAGAHGLQHRDASGRSASA